ncbi:M15 family metallopeptidase [Kutzneria buriramensis]|uniref:D-alanyl-D-alanine carboxypeptidase-like protein n=1 Tax=Kutzneria buriramensis TaxID=1045776 RepID=A0A3E0GZT8_9PSEU|nr:M15 family metallopeptidase [Kutzneria buriramensis]REH33065.1 D-alanyl-D-alanine carboxypeptidase-like protein [Kutzneria buriramensis]
MALRLVAVVLLALLVGGCGGRAVGRPGPTDTTTDGPLGAADGVIADDAGISPFDTGLPAIAKLDAGLLDAVQKAATDAAAKGITMRVTSGWRSKAYQQQLLDDAVRTYGGMNEARKHVATPDASHHITGKAVDIGPTNADDWLQRHGADYGLCQAYANEMWHFELVVAPGLTCPQPLPDAAS